MSTSEVKQKQITILGIGNTLYSDEGVGVQVIPLLEDILKDYESKVEIIEGATDGIKLLGPVEDTEYLIIIDAINADKEPGSIITVDQDEIPKYFGVKMSIHQVGFQEVLFAAQIRENLPKQMIMFGIQPESLKLGVELTDTVKSKLPDLACLIKEKVESWLDQHE
ncbi:hydrogenase maturation protease [Anaerobacillus arseniciselenatis]|uniref:Hydrogenase maturation protease n=1 Tax=Anaerobacillus arseniciselenatis TaxID=85682 RepID=A0A1S2LTB1_9BACI|nr:HyaD/HybD family hydrogenase maturation endopeptidase [Anaerobacillus arseniciselenatis]OIJ15779.1 hydrogenase maturation protease [Anaerobacillus arseniciselenatis]